MIGVLKSNSLVAVTTEVVEGTPVTPTLGTQFIEVLSDGLEFAPAKELVERSIITSSIGNAAPRTSIKSCAGSIPVEYKGSGVSGTAPPYDPLLMASLGSKKTVATFTTTALGTTTTLEATGNTYAVGDFLVLQIPGDYHSCFVTAVAGDTVTFTPATTAAVPDATVIAPSVVYIPTNTAQPTISPFIYWGDEITESGGGCRVASMAVENFTTGQIPSLNFAIEGLNYSRVDGSAPVAPTYAPGMPPVVLGATLSQGGECIKINEFAMSVENTIAWIATVCSLNGRIGSMYSNRAIAGSFNPYLDDTSTDWFDKFNTDELFELTLTLGIPSTVAGEVVLGSVVGIYMPSVMILETPITDLDGILVDSIAFSCNTGVNGNITELYMGFA